MCSQRKHSSGKDDTKNGGPAKENDRPIRPVATQYGPLQGTCKCPILSIGSRASYSAASICGMPRFRSCACCPHTPCIRHTVEMYTEPTIGSPIDGMRAGVCKCCESDRSPHITRWRATSSRPKEQTCRNYKDPDTKPASIQL